jgi:hypothetical protein
MLTCFLSRRAHWRGLSRRCGELSFPEIAGGFLVNGSKDEVENFRVPADCVAFDALLDVLWENH